MTEYFFYGIASMIIIIFLVWFMYRYTIVGETNGKNHK
jgi:hypothetical protein